MSSKEIEAKGLWESPDEYVDKAEEVIRTGKAQISTTKLRNLMSLVNDMRNEERLNTDKKNIGDKTAAKVAMMRVRLAYECGRDSEVNKFVQKAELTKYLKEIKGSREKLDQFANYMEALVAFQRYYSMAQNKGEE